MTSIFYERFKTLLLEQYKESKNLNNILEVISTTFEELDQVFKDLKEVLNIDKAKGKIIDLIGDIVGEKRNGREDEEYLKYVKFKIFKNTSRCFVDDVVKILKFITNASIVIYSDNPPASYTIYTNGLEVPKDIKKILDKLSAAGVSLIVYASLGETPFIATELSIQEYNLVDQSDNQFIENLGNELILHRQESDDVLQEIFQGKGFGVVEILQLTTNENDLIISDQGDNFGSYREDQKIIDSGKANLVYQ
jgi:hypothetical protein